MKYYNLRNKLWSEPLPDVRVEWMVTLPYWRCEEFADKQGRSISDWNSNLFGFHEGPLDKQYDFPLCNDEQLHIVSSSLRDALNELAPNCFQFLSFRLRSPVGDQIIEGYSLANYLQLLDVVDRKRSTLLPGETRFRKMGGQFLLDKVVLNVKKATCPVFRVAGSQGLHIYREDVVDRLLAQGFTGLVFSEIPS